MTHFAEDPAIRRSNALDGAHGAVGVEGGVHGGLALQVNILSGDLAVFRQLLDQGLACQELALAVGNGHIVDIAHLGQAQPGALVGGHPGSYNPALMAADGVEGQGGAGVIGVDDLAVGHQTQLDEGLEAVADAAHQAVPVIQELHHLLLDGRIPEKGGDELGGAVGLVAAGEAAGQEDHLAVSDFFDCLLHASCHVLGGQVPDHQNLRLSARRLHRPGGVVLAVGAGEHGNQHLGLGALHRRGGVRSGLVVKGGNGLVGLHGLGGIDLLQNGSVDGIEFGNGSGVAVVADHRLGGGYADLLAEIAVLGELGDETAVPGAVEPDGAFGLGKADVIAEGHLHHRLGNAAGIHRIGGLHLTGKAQAVEFLPGGLHGIVAAAVEEVHRVSGFLEFPRNDFACLQGGDGERNQGGGHVLIEERAGHGVLAADGRGIQVELGIQRAKQCLEGLAPTLRLISQLLEELLQGQVSLFVVRTGGHDLGHGGNHRGLGSQIGVGTQQVGITAPGHDAGGVGVLTGQHRQLGGHGLSRGGLVLAAEGHEKTARADGSVEPLHKASLGGKFQLTGQSPQVNGVVVNKAEGTVPVGNLHAGVLHRAVGVQEIPGKIGDFVTLPGHNHPGFLRDQSHPIGLQVFFLGGGDEGIRVLRGNHHRHPLLGLGNGQLRAVQTLILLAHHVQIDAQAVGQLADGHGHAAGAEVVAAFDEPGDLAAAEESLNLPLLRGVALLNLGSHGGQGF